MLFGLYRTCVSLTCVAKALGRGAMVANSRLQIQAMKASRCNGNNRATLVWYTFFLPFYLIVYLICYTYVHEDKDKLVGGEGHTDSFSLMGLSF